MMWSDAQIDHVAKLRQSGLAYSAIAKKLGVSRGAVIGLASRNRDLFPKEPVQAAPTKPAKVKAPARFVWTDEKRIAAAVLWKQGQSARQIGAELGVDHSSVIRQVQTHRALFSKSNKSKVQARKAKKRVKSSARLADIGVKARDRALTGSKRDLSKFHAPDEAPVTLLNAGARQCRFPLARFDDPASDQMLCCGAETLEGQSWCATHYRIVFPGRGV